MEIETVTTCPLGSTCSEIVDGKIHRCGWLTTIKGTDALEKEVETTKCAMAWMPTLQVENIGTMREMSSSVDSLRNETVKGQQNQLKAQMIAINSLGADVETRVIGNG